MIDDDATTDSNNPSFMSSSRLLVCSNYKVSRGTTKFCAAHGGGARCHVPGCGRAVVPR